MQASVGLAWAGSLARAGWHFDRRPTGARAGAEAERAAEASGAWLALAQVAAVDPSAPSWEFLQVQSISTPAA